MKQLILKRKIEFLEYAIKYYSKNVICFDSICILFADTWLKRPHSNYSIIKIKFPELWTEIEKVLKRQAKSHVIEYKSFTKSRIRLLKRVRKQLWESLTYPSDLKLYAVAILP